MPSLAQLARGLSWPRGMPAPAGAQRARPRRPAPSRREPPSPEPGLWDGSAAGPAARAELACTQLVGLRELQRLDEPAELADRVREGDLDLRELLRECPDAAGRQRLLDGFEGDLRGARLAGADLRGADLSGCRLSGADLREARLGGAQLDGADLCGADLRRADLRHGSARSAGLEAAWLDGADLRGCDLSGARFREARLHDADLRGARLDTSRLQGAHSGPGTRLGAGRGPAPGRRQ